MFQSVSSWGIFIYVCACVCVMFQCFLSKYFYQGCVCVCDVSGCFYQRDVLILYFRLFLPGHCGCFVSEWIYQGFWIRGWFQNVCTRAVWVFCISECFYQGEVYPSGAQFRPDACSTCTCEKGTVQCRTQDCPPANCPKPVTPAMACCPACDLGEGRIHFRTPGSDCVH